MTVLLRELQFYKFECPSFLQRKIRATVKCNESDKYICLFDDNMKYSRESCRNKPEFDKPGKYKQNVLLVTLKKGKLSIHNDV